MIVNYIYSETSELDPKLESLAFLDGRVQKVYVYYTDKGIDNIAEVSRALGISLTHDLMIDRPSAKHFIISARVGSVSSWSSKCMKMLQDCNIKVLGIEKALYYSFVLSDSCNINDLKSKYFDAITQAFFNDISELKNIFCEKNPITFNKINLSNGIDEMLKFNSESKLGISKPELNRIYKYCSNRAGAYVTGTELMMLAQVNSEHCRHKIFNAQNNIGPSLFSMIRSTHKSTPKYTVSAYDDNAAVVEGANVNIFIADKTKAYKYKNIELNSVIKVETHNHPTGISPLEGAGTGVGGEIRDIAATGRGALPIAGISGYMVSNVNLGCLKRDDVGIATPLKIMIDAPLGASMFSNEFGRPSVFGFFRSFEYKDKASDFSYGYKKPIMLSGGLGYIISEYSKKTKANPGDLILHIGGYGYSIGIGGGSASSAHTDEEYIDRKSVQRMDALVQRLAQGVINDCAIESEYNPILLIHDVGAGGVGNAISEIVHDTKCGATIALRDIPVAESGMGPTGIWSNESQERYIIIINAKDLDYIDQLCNRESCYYSVIGTLTEEKRLVVNDAWFDNKPIDLELDFIFSSDNINIDINTDDAKSVNNPTKFNSNGLDLAELTSMVLAHPTVASKRFIINISDRSVGGLTIQDSCVGLWQIPVSDAAIMAMDYDSNKAQVITTAERSPIAVFNPEASVRMAMAEIITNISSVYIDDISRIKLSANWMADSEGPGELAKLYQSVKQLSSELCNKLGISVIVGKDSLFMSANNNGELIRSPMSVVLTAYAYVPNIERRLNASFIPDNNTRLILIDLSRSKNRLGASILSDVLNIDLSDTADIDDVEDLRNYFNAIQELHSYLLGYHDRSDGGLMACLSEILLASRIGMEIFLDAMCFTGSENDIDSSLSSELNEGIIKDKIISSLFNEEAGAVLQVSQDNLAACMHILRKHGLGSASYIIGCVNTETRSINFYYNARSYYSIDLETVDKYWNKFSYGICKLRDNPILAATEFQESYKRGPIFIDANKDYRNIQKPVFKHTKPKAGIIRGPGTNGYREMAAALDYVGFESIDVAIIDIAEAEFSLDDFNIIVFCGGFSYGDIPSSGTGWANSILYNNKLLDKFKFYFNRQDSLSLGICNGCQLMSQLKDIIPGANNWLKLKQNDSKRFESRVVMTKIAKSNSVFFKDMEGWCLPVFVAHGEGRIAKNIYNNKSICLNYIDSNKNISMEYPYNPNGSYQGIAGLSSEDGRATIIMPHPERAFFNKQAVWERDINNGITQWFKFFDNSFKWVDSV